MSLKKVIRKLENGQTFETECFWDNGWYTKDGISINDVIEVKIDMNITQEQTREDYFNQKRKEFMSTESKLSIEEYQRLAARTNAKLESKMMDNIHMALGMQTESAELSDVFKKHIAYGKEIDWVNIKEELGDLMFYVANMCNINDWDLRDILNTNIKKLKIRYPQKFTNELAENRNLRAEREVLEKA